MARNNTGIIVWETLTSAIYIFFNVYVCTELLCKINLSVGHNKKCLNATILKEYIYITVLLFFSHFSETLLINNHLLTLISAYKHVPTPCS